MALTLPPNFANDIQGRDTALVPIIQIGNAEPYIFISTNELTMGDAHFMPILLNVPSLKESIDIEKRNYKISSVNLDISNFPYEGLRFSERVSDSLINVNCHVAWKSPSVSTIGNFTDTTDAFLVYFGTIRRYTHDDEKVRLVVEDRSQATLHKDLPTANLGADDDVPDKYKNKPIPMVYGHVDRSPCIIKVETLPDIPEYSALKNIIVDSKPIDKFVEEQVSLNQYGNLKIYGGLFVGDPSLGYTPCARTFKYSIKSSLFYDVLPYIDDDNQNYSYDADNAIINLEDDADNDAKRGILRGIIPRVPNDVKINSNAAEGEPNVPTSSYGFIAIKNHNTTQYTGGGTNLTIMGSDNWLEDEITTNTSATMLRIINNDIDQGICVRNFIMGSEPLDGGFGNEYMAARVELSPTSCGFDADSYFIGAFFHYHGYSFADNDLQWENIATRIWIGNYVMHGSELANNGATWFSNTNLGSSNQSDPFTLAVDNGAAAPSSITNFNIGAPKYTASSAGDAQVHINIWSANIFHVTYVDKLVDRDFYANVIGRQDSGDENTIPDAPTTQSYQAIHHIMHHELGVPTGSLHSPPADTGYNNWYYAFTVDEKINSKKLIEGIASASPYIPRFDNMGNFKLYTIKETYNVFDVINDQDGGSENHKIHEHDLIDFSFSRTKIEQIYTKVVFNYNYDYTRGIFNKSVAIGIEDIIGSDVYDYDYYGLKHPIFEDGVWTHPESTLIIDDDRGKYIRDDTTAGEFAEWILMWSINQHIKMKLKLPLKHLNLEIGDIIEFDSVLGKVKPYGIDYTDLSVSLNGGQNQYNKFMIMSTNKTLEFVDIECIQMHNLTSVFIVWGCMDNTGENNPEGSQGACNYNADANHDNGSCLYPVNDWRDCDGNCIYGDTDGDGLCDGAAEDGSGGEDEFPDCEDLSYDECGECGGDGATYPDCGVAFNEGDYHCTPEGAAAVICGCSEPEYVNYDPDINESIPQICLPPIIMTDHCPWGHLGSTPTTNEFCDDPDWAAWCSAGGSWEDVNTGVFYEGNEGINWSQIYYYCSTHPVECSDVTQPFFPRILNEIYCTTAAYPENITLNSATLHFYGAESDGFPNMQSDSIFHEDPNPNFVTRFLDDSIAWESGLTTLHLQWQTPEALPIETGHWHIKLERLESDIWQEKNYYISPSVDIAFFPGADWNYADLDNALPGAIIVDEALLTRDSEFKITMTLHGDETTYSTIYVQQITYLTYRYVEDEAPHGDMNSDTAFNVLDIVLLVNCVLGISNTPFCGDGENWYTADMNEDGNYNVLDVVILANCVLAESCEG